MKKNFTIKLIILFILLFFLKHNALAVSLDLNADKNVLQQGDILTLVISLNTDGQSINTIEGDLKYDDNFIKPESVNIGGSFISFWVEKPDLKTSGIIHFSGIVPGGISAIQSEVFKVIFRAKNAGNTSLLLNNVNLFLNDGEGSLVPAKIINMNIKIIQRINTQNTLDLISGDKVPPEKFSIIRSQDSSLFDSKYFIAFSAIDKKSGIDRYQVCELLKCISAESPFLLWNQTPFYHIVVKAYDMDGNSTSATLISPWFASLLVFLLLIVIIYSCFCIQKNFIKK